MKQIKSIKILKSKQKMNRWNNLKMTYRKTLLKMKIKKFLIMKRLKRIKIIKKYNKEI